MHCICWQVGSIDRTILDYGIIILGFPGLVGFNELSFLQCTDIKFVEYYVEVNIEKCRTDQYKFVIATDRRFYVMAISLLRYFQIANTQNNFTLFLLKSIFKSRKKAELTIYKNRNFSYIEIIESV